MKARLTLPGIATGLIVALALGLFAHTAISRRHAAAIRRAAAPAVAGKDSPAFVSPLPASRPATSAAEHAAEVEKRVRAARSLGSPLDRTRALLTLTKDFTSDDFRIAVHACPSNSERYVEGELDPLFEEWARRDPLAAISDPASDQIMRSRALQIWTEKDPRGAIDYAVGQKAAADPQGRILVRVLGQIALKSPDLILQQMHRFGPEVLAGPFALINSRADAATRAVIRNWLDSLPDRAGQEDAAKLLFSSWGNDNAPAEKFALLKRFPTSLSKQVLDANVGPWLDFDPVAAQDALERLPEDPDRPAIFGNLLSRLIDRDDGAALSSLRQRFPDEVTDERISAEIASSTRREPPQSIAKLPLIRDPGLRNRTRAKILSDWTTADPAAARQWSAAHDGAEPVPGP